MKESKRSRWSVALVVIGLLLPAGLFAQTNLNVTCVGPDGAPARGVKVFLQSLSNAKPEEKKTNKDGVANFKKVESGFYRVIARAEGMAPALRDLLWIRSEPSVDVELTLKAGSPEQALYFEDDAVLARANQLTQEAVDAFGTNDLEAAEAKLTEALELYPSSPFVHQNLGLAALRLQRWEEGEQHLRHAADYMEIFAELGETRLADARQQVLAAIATIPLQKLSVEANALMTEKKYDEALPKFEEMKRAAPDNPDVYYNIALAQAHAGMIPGAKEAITKALELRPTDAEFAKLRDQILQIERTGVSLRAKEIVDGLQNLYEQKEYQAVVERSRDALKDIPEENQHTVHQLMGRAQIETGDYPGAIQSYHNSIELNGENKAAVLKELAANLINKEQYDSSFEIYSEYYAAANEPADEGFYELGSLLSNKGKAEQAGQLFKKVLEINPDHVEAHYSLGMYYFYDKNDRPNAKKLLERYLEIGKDASKLDNAKSVLIVMEKTK